MRSTWLLVFVSACAHAGGAAGGGDGGGGFRVFYPDTTAKHGKHFQAKPSADCKREDGSEARWAATGARVEKGELPPGLTIEDAAVGGVPTKPGSYAITLVVTGVTCASKPLPDQHVDVTIVVR